MDWFSLLYIAWLSWTSSKKRASEVTGLDVLGGWSGHEWLRLGRGGGWCVLFRFTFLPSFLCTIHCLFYYWKASLGPSTLWKREWKRRVEKVWKMSRFYRGKNRIGKMSSGGGGEAKRCGSQGCLFNYSVRNPHVRGDLMCVYMDIYTDI